MQYSSILYTVDISAPNVTTCCVFLLLFYIKVVKSFLDSNTKFVFPDYKNLT